MNWDLGFVEPANLLLLLGVFPLVAFLRFAGRSLAHRCAQLGVRGSTNLILQDGALLLTFLLLSLALARPYAGFREIRVPSNARDIMVVFDVSDSMRTDDIKPSRLLAAKRKLEDFLSLLRDERRGDRIGIVLFSGGSYLYCPLTSDYTVVRRFAHSVTPELITKGGSTLADAVKTGVDSLVRAEATHGSVLVISDGEDNSLSESVVSELVALSFPISSIGVGTIEGKPIPLPSGAFVKNSSGEIVISKLLEENMQRLASESGGVYSRISLSDSDIQAVLEATAKRFDRRADKGAIRVYNELGPFLCVVALVLLAVSALTPRYRVLFGVLLPLSLVMAPHPARADPLSLPSTVYEGSKLYEEEEYEAAEAIFKDALSKDPSNSSLALALGNTQHRLGKYADAVKSFAQGEQSAATEPERFRAAYNQGTSHYLANNFKEAVGSLERALQILPSDTAAQFNLELAKKRLQEEEQKKQADKKKDESQTEDKKDSEKQESNEQEQPQNSSDKNSPQEKEQEKDSDQKTEREKNEAKEKSPQPGEKKEESSNKDGSSDETPQDSDSKNEENPTEEGKDGEDRELEDRDIKKEQAQAWLDSLSDAPVLLRRQNPRNTTNNGQTW